MLLNRQHILDLGLVLKKIQKENQNLDISIKYKILKLEENIEKEMEIISTLLDELVQKYAEVNEKGEKNITEKGVKIDSNRAASAQKELNTFLEGTAQICDFYFSLDEIQKLNLTWEELKIFMPFIKN